MGEKFLDFSRALALERAKGVPFACWRRMQRVSRNVVKGYEGCAYSLERE